MAGSSKLPNGYQPTQIDSSRFQGDLKALSPAQKELMRLTVRDPDVKNKRNIVERQELPIPKLKALSDIISNTIQASIDLRSITPYIKRAEQIWVTLLLKPNGIQDNILTYDTSDTKIKNSALYSRLCQIVENYFTNDFPFEEKLPQIIKDVMFRTGSYIFLNISHAAIDHVINGMQIEGKENLKADLRELEQTLLKTDYDRSIKTVKNIGHIRKEKITLTNGFESLYGNPVRENEIPLLAEEFKFTFTDNPVVFKMATLKQQILSQQTTLHSGNENINDAISTVFNVKSTKGKKANPNHVNIANKNDFDKTMDRIYPQRRYQDKESISIRSSQFYTGGNRGIGLVEEPPSECTIPVHLNGKIGKPFGYIFLTDPETFNFLQSTGDVKFYSANKNRRDRVDTMPRAGSMNSIISNIKYINEGRDCEIDMDWVVDFISANIEKEMVEYIMNGEKGGNISLSMTEANINLYMQRALKLQGVRAIFVPAEYVTYFAVDYNSFGVGKSLVEEAKMIITRLAILDIADTYANIEQAISKTQLTVDLEEEDFDPYNTIAQIREKYLAANPSILNFIGFSNIPIDTIVDGVKNSLVKIRINGGDNRYIISPNIDEQQETREGIKPIESDSREKALTSLASFFDLKRSWLEDSEDGNNFAIEALSDQELLRNTTIERSRLFSFFISDFMSKHIQINQKLLNELIVEIKNSKKDYEKPDKGGSLLEDGDEKNEQAKVLAVLSDFLNALDVSLPLPSTIETTNKLVDKIEAADKLVNAWKEIGVAGKMFEYLKGRIDDLSDDPVDIDVDLFWSQIESVLKRMAFERLGIFIPFDDITSKGDKGGVAAFVQQITSQTENTISFLEEVFKENKKLDKRILKLAKKYSNEPDNDDSDHSSSEFEETPTDDNPSNEEPSDPDLPPGDDDTPEGDEPTDDDTPEGDDETPAENPDDIASDLDKGMPF